MAGDIPYMTMCLLVALLNVAPLYWQIEHRNSGVVCLGFWVILLNLTNFINAFIWRNDAIDRAPVLCDISSKIQLAAPLGSICANLCITRLLAEVVSPAAKSSFSQRDRRRREIFDYAFSIGVPLFFAAIQILVQPSRYAIIQTVGCSSTWVLTWATYACYIFWVPFLSFAGCFISSYVIFRLARHRFQFSKLVSASNSALTVSRFMRLTALALASIVFNTVLSVITAIGTAQAGGPYIDYSWNYIHHLFSTLIQETGINKATFGNWGSVIAGINVILFFGLGSEALSTYTRFLRFIGLERLVRISVNKAKRTKHTHPVDEIALSSLPHEPDADVKKYPTGPTAFSDITTYGGPFDLPYTGEGRKHMAVQVIREEHIV